MQCVIYVGPHKVKKYKCRVTECSIKVYKICTHLLTGLLVGRFTCQASKPADAQTGLADTLDARASKLE